MTEILEKGFSRRTFLKGGGALVVGFSMAGSLLGAKAPAAPPAHSGQRARPARPERRSTRGSSSTPTTPRRSTRQGQHGHGLADRLLMIAAEELDMDFSQMREVVPDTNTVVNQGATAARTASPAAARRCAAQPRPRSRRCSAWPRRSSACRPGSSASARASSRAGESPSRTAAYRRQGLQHDDHDADSRHRAGRRHVEAAGPVRPRRQAAAAPRHPGEGRRRRGNPSTSGVQP